ncbi:acetyltransferase [Robertkochia aurantiaca]|uniref:acetyltransferase n=1 Tax=Robertkochia aurantiaca TaxID=2873700 RepID=UPI001CCF8587|nr:acetyltransferase [Robertkochia sp. 3YJGBD-33]
MQKKVFIVGAGGLGRQIEFYAESHPDFKNGSCSLEGYIDDNPGALDNKFSRLSVVGNVDDYLFEPDDRVILAIGNIEQRERIVAKLQSRAEIISFIANDTTIGFNTIIGKGVVICPDVHIGCNCLVEDYCLINLKTIVGHDSTLGEFSSLMPRSDIGGGSKVGKKVYMGTKATISPGLEICDEVFIGVNTTVLKSIHESGTYFGLPARKMS